MEPSSSSSSSSGNTTARPASNSSQLPTEPPFLKKLAHLDKGLYNDFYSVWITLVVINMLIFVVGLALNSLALYVFCLRTKPKTTSVVYTINLVVTDLLVGLSLPARIILYYSGGKCLVCSYVHIFSYFVNMYCSILFLTSICVDRYLAIVQLEASRKWRSPGVAKAISACIWLFAFVVTYSSLTTALKQGACCLSKLFALTVFEFFLPLVVIAGFTARITCTLAGPRLMQQSRERRMRAVQLLLTVLLIFTVCFTPFHVHQVLAYFYPDMPHHVVAYHATVTLSSLNSCMDPVVYCFVTNNFRSAMRAVFRKAEPEHTSGDVISMQRSSRGSRGSGTGSPAADTHGLKLTEQNAPQQGSLPA